MNAPDGYREVGSDRVDAVYAHGTRRVAYRVRARHRCRDWRASMAASAREAAIVRRQGRGTSSRELADRLEDARIAPANGRGVECRAKGGYR